MSLLDLRERHIKPAIDDKEVKLGHMLHSTLMADVQPQQISDLMKNIQDLVALKELIDQNTHKANGSDYIKELYTTAKNLGINVEYHERKPILTQKEAKKTALQQKRADTSKQRPKLKVNKKPKTETKTKTKAKSKLTGVKEAVEVKLIKEYTARLYLLTDKEWVFSMQTDFRLYLVGDVHQYQLKSDLKLSDVSKLNLHKSGEGFIRTTAAGLELIRMSPDDVKEIIEIYGSKIDELSVKIKSTLEGLDDSSVKGYVADPKVTELFGGPVTKQATEKKPITKIKAKLSKRKYKWKTKTYTGTESGLYVPSTFNLNTKNIADDHLDMAIYAMFRGPRPIKDQLSTPEALKEILKMDNIHEDVIKVHSKWKTKVEEKGTIVST